MPKKVTKKTKKKRNYVHQVKKINKTGAERSREYRRRVRDLFDAVAAGPVTDTVDIQTVSQYNLEQSSIGSRENQNLPHYEALTQQSQDEQESGDNHHQILVHVDVHKENLLLLSEDPSTSAIQIQSSTKKPKSLKRNSAKTPAERVRAYRKRQKLLRNATNQSVAVDEPLPPESSGTPVNEIQMDNSNIPYSEYRLHDKAHKEFKKIFIDRSFGQICSVCDRLWFKNDLKKASVEHEEILKEIVSNRSIDEILVCNTCRSSLRKNRIPIMSSYNGFKFPPLPSYLPPLDPISERLISQSLRAHSADLTDAVIRKSNIVILSETWLNNDEDVSIPNFNCIVKYKRRDVRAGGVAIYHNKYDTVNIITPNMEITALQTESCTSTTTPTGDICIAEARTSNGKIIVIAAIYISPNKKLEEIITFIHRSLLIYSHGGAALVGTGEDKIPMILGGDFNVNFASENSLPLVDFLREKFSLVLNNNVNESTTKSGTTIDGIFARFLDNIGSRTYVSYFSFHKPLISVLPIEPPHNNDSNIE